MNGAGMYDYRGKRSFQGISLFFILSLLFLIGQTKAVAGMESRGRWDVGVIDAGECLYTCLQSDGVPQSAIRRIIQDLRPHLDLARLRPGATYRYEMEPGGELREFSIRHGHHLWLIRMADGAPDSVRRFWCHGMKRIETISIEYQDSVCQTFARSGEGGYLARQFEEILATDLDPPIYMQAGDRFSLVVEKHYAGGRLMRYGDIKAFVLHRGESRISAVRYKGRYYDEKGSCWQRQFLRVPLHYQFVSSKFMASRVHPILGGRRPHRGIDLAAPVGTPIRAIADGRVEIAGWLSGYGRTVVIRHAYGYGSLYAHLQDFAENIKAGQGVARNQVIGHVGMSGLTTGPHLHYGLTRNRVDCDPLNEEFPREKITEDNDYLDFCALRDALLPVLNRAHPESAMPIGALADFGVGRKF